jgi:hypothetical protein
MDSDVHRSRHLAVVTGICTVLTLVVACSTSSEGKGNDSGEPEAGNCTSPGGPVAGAQDMHCDSDAGPTVQVVDQAACTGAAPSSDASAGGGDDGGGDADGGCLGGYGPTMFNQSGADDDCKYDVQWTSTPVCEGQPTYFTVTATYRVDHTPVTGAYPVPDVVLNCAHPIPNTPRYVDPSPETSPGVYTVGPIVFDQPGRWVFRFHFFEHCNDVPASPHGHAAFFVDVP